MEELDIKKLVTDNPEIASSVETLQAQLARLTKNKEQANKLLSVMLGKGFTKPKGWGINSHAAYYNEKYGAFVRSKLDSMVEGKDLLIKMSEMKVSRKTMKQIFSQGYHYLREHMPEPEKYTALRERIEIKVVQEGVLLCWKPTKDPLQSEDTHLEPQAPNMKWKEQFENFILTAEDNQKLVLEDLRLNEECIMYIKDRINTTPGLFPKEIGTTRLEVIKNLKLWTRLYGHKETPEA